MVGAYGLPAAIGALRGAPLGPWGMVGSGLLGAAMGGAGMEAARETMVGEPISPGAIAGQGVEQALMQAPAAAIGPAGRGLQGIRAWARNKAIRQAVKEVNEPLIAGRAAKKAALVQEVPAAVAERQAAAAATKAEIAGAKGDITAADLAERIIAQRESRFGVQVTPKVRAQIINDVKMRLARVIPTYTGRLISGKKPVFDMPTSQIGKQAFDDLVRAVHTGKEGGIRPKPNIDLDIADAWRSLIEDRVPNVAALNRVTAAAIREEVGVKKLQKAIPSGRAARVGMQARDAATAARVLAQRTWNPLRLVRQIPTEGNVAAPTIGYRPGTLAEMGGKIGTGFRSVPAEQLAFWIPRAVAAYGEFIRQQEQEQPNPFGTPPQSFLPP